jgi:hypothetical protein
MSDQKYPTNGHLVDPALGMSQDQAAAMAEEANEWYSCLQAVQPTALRFIVRVVPAMVRTDEGPTTKMIVRMTAVTPLGPIVTHLPADLADELAALLSRFSLEARTGIQVVPGRRP